MTNHLLFGECFSDPIGLEALVGYELNTEFIEPAICKKWQCAVATHIETGQHIYLIANFHLPYLFDWALHQLPHSILLCSRQISTEDFATWLEQQQAGSLAMPGMVKLDSNTQKKLGRETLQLSFANITDTQSAVIRLVNSTLYDAVQVGASDIHLETAPKCMTIRYRLDGVLSLITTIEQSILADQIISRIKVLSELDISEKRTPQDGRFKVEVSGREIDLRVSIMPSVHGEDAVIRVLDRRTLLDEHGCLRLAQLGFDSTCLQQWTHLTQSTHGMLLVTGPTGSGKTTTLYAALMESKNDQEKVITIEDPVEYQLPGVLQIPVNEKKGLTFAKGLRSILRHDPDKIMVGEIRDQDTAQVAVQSALTGHLVFSSIHANSSLNALSRLLHLGVERYSFASALNGVMAQRLLRTLCTQCQISGHAIGCSVCKGSGYKGRMAIGEVLTMNDELRDMIVGQASMSEIKRKTFQQGTVPLYDAGLSLVKRGLTTQEELNRVAFSIH